MEKNSLSTQSIHPLAIEVCKTLQQNGHQAFIVGGCVRDLLLGLPPKDWDICTDASPQKIIKIFPKTIPTGLQHGTVTVCMGEGPENHFEVTTFRLEGAYTDGRRPDEVFFIMNVEQDLARRDLTINAIAYDPIDNRLVDPYHGIQDLRIGTIKAVGDPDARFREDGLRIMRVARFAARFGYAIDVPTLFAMNQNLDTLRKVSKERIKDELSKTLMTKNPFGGLQILIRAEVLPEICPLLVKAYENIPYPNLDQCQGELETRLALLYSFCEAQLAETEMLSLKFSGREVKKVVFLLQLLERYQDFIEKDTTNAYKSFMAVVKNHSYEAWEATLEQFILLTEALGYGSREYLAKFQSERVFSKKEMQINGDDLMSIGIKPGPQIKSILDNCYLEILRNPDHNNKLFLLSFASR